MLFLNWVTWIISYLFRSIASIILAVMRFRRLDVRRYMRKSSLWYDILLKILTEITWKFNLINGSIGLVLLKYLQKYVLIIYYQNWSKLTFITLYIYLMNNFGVTTTHSRSTTNDALNVFIYILEYNVMLSVCVC